MISPARPRKAWMSRRSWTTEVGGHVAAVDVGVGLVEPVEVGVHRHRPPGGPPLVDGHLAHPGPGGDGLHGGGLEAALDEQVGGRLEGGQPGPLAPRAPDGGGDGRIGIRSRSRS